jgi:hypothetical protein
MHINALLFLLFFINLFIFTHSENKEIYYLNKYNQLYKAEKYETRRIFKYSNFTFVCDNADKDCGGKGQCFANKTDCECDVGYMSVPNSYVKCTYSQKFLSTALILEGLLGFGFGHLYRGNLIFFVGKFLFYFFSCCFNFCVFVFVGAVSQSNVNKETYDYVKRSTCILVPLMIGWYIVDLVMFFIGNYGDSNGFPLN